ncbi:MAG: Uma2 family endonuclease [Ktedonobacterales bacterium]
MKQDIIAPWAEPAPGAPDPMTTEEMLALADDGWQYELVEGRLVRMPGSGVEASEVTLILAAALLSFVRPRKLGVVTESSGTFILSRAGQPDTALCPDVAYVEAARAPAKKDPDYAKAWRVAPNLVVEVASPNQFRPGMAAKVRLYLDAGVQLVWVIWPERREVDVWRPGSEAPAEALGVADQLDGRDVLPGFTHPVADLFG